MTLAMQYREKYKEGLAEGRAETLKKLIKAGAEKACCFKSIQRKNIPKRKPT